MIGQLVSILLPYIEEDEAVNLVTSIFGDEFNNKRDEASLEDPLKILEKMIRNISN